MKVNRYNTHTHEYEDYEIPDRYNTPLFTNDMNEIVNCCQCRKELNYGSCYTSLEVHNDFGLGYPVCSSCYEEEHYRRRLEEKQNENN